VLIGVESIKMRAAPCIHCGVPFSPAYYGVDGVATSSAACCGAYPDDCISTVTFAIVISTFLAHWLVTRWVDNDHAYFGCTVGLSVLALSIAIVTILHRLINVAGDWHCFYSAYARAIPSVLTVREMDFVAASKSLGGGTMYLLFGRILPNSLTPLIVQGTLGIATGILDAAALSFLGLGAQPPTPEWGTMLGAERNQVFTAPHLVFYPNLGLC
jgi:ABC-type dipeptide/oligopeptide/nickel transport system permease subunit